MTLPLGDLAFKVPSRLGVAVMHPAVRALFIAFVVFTTPIVYAIAANWESVQKYVNIRSEDARGYVLVFDVKG